MKKILALLLMVVCVSGTMAQKGMSSIGVDIPINYRKNNVSMGIGINYQYNFSNYLRGEFVGGFSPIHFSSASSSAGRIGDFNGNQMGTITTEYAYVNWQAFLNAHIFFISPRPIRPYCIIGCGIQAYQLHRLGNVSGYQSADSNNNATSIDNSFTQGAMVANIGLGVDIRLNYKWSMQIAILALTAFEKADFENITRYSPSSYEHGFTMEAAARVGINYNF